MIAQIDWAPTGGFSVMLGTVNFTAKTPDELYSKIAALADAELFQGVTFRKVLMHTYTEDGEIEESKMSYVVEHPLVSFKTEVVKRIAGKVAVWTTAAGDSVQKEISQVGRFVLDDEQPLSSVAYVAIVDGFDSPAVERTIPLS